METKTTFLSLIDSITKWGLYSNPQNDTGLEELRRSLAKLYAYCVTIDYDFEDETSYPDSPDVDYNAIRQTVAVNFPDFGYYYALSTFNPYEEPELHMGDAIDDLADIISDLLETKWRFDNNGENDALWFLELNFISHFEQHIIDLLHYIRNM